MCGIVGYVGPEQAGELLVEGLARLEYRGYDSAGVAVLGARGPKVHKTAGRVAGLRGRRLEALAGRVGIGHTRWATHGAPTDGNAHPHLSADGRVAIVHNGIIDNAAALRRELEAAGVELASETDSEVLAHLVARSAATTLEGAVTEALERVHGTYGLAVVHADHPDRIVVARNGSPLVVGIGEDECLVASDPAALVTRTRRVVYLEDGDLATVTADGVRTVTAGGVGAEREPVTLELRGEDLDLGDHEHYMLKEIREQPEAVERVLRGRLDERFHTVRLDGLNLDAREARAVRRVKFLGCGTAYYAGQIAAQFVEEIARVPADAEPASEFRYRNPVVDPDTLYVAVSQSGETYDTLVAVQELRRKGGRVVGLVNVVGSSIARECDGGLYLHAGPEISVASTKALTTMVVAGALLGVHLGRVRDLSPADGRRMVRALRALPDALRAALADEPAVEAAAKVLAAAPGCFFVGRVRGYPVAREGAQKLKEISYLHAEAYPTSELKHGPLALIGPDLPTVAVVPDDELLERNVGALHEIAARSGPLLVVTHPGVDLGGVEATVLTVPRSEPELDPVLLTLPLQLLAYHVARTLGHDVDKPRNLAKSVTVE